MRRRNNISKHSRTEGTLTTHRFGLTCAAIACATLAVAGCTKTISGTASPAPNVSTPTSAGTDVFAGMNACQVLGQLVAGQGFEPGENKTRRNECGVTKIEFGTYGLSLDPVQGLAEFAAADPGATETTVNGRAAMQAIWEVGHGCAVAVEVTEHARAVVDVVRSRVSEADKSCSDAHALAEKLEPLLPKVP